MTAVVLQPSGWCQWFSASATVATVQLIEPVWVWHFLIRITIINGHVNAQIFSVEIRVKLTREGVDHSAYALDLCASMTQAQPLAIPVAAVFLDTVGSQMKKDVLVCTPARVLHYYI
jgi:hypothetical protein